MSSSISISVVLYKNSSSQLVNLFNSLDKFDFDFDLYIIDNSPTSIKYLIPFSKFKIFYLFYPENLGYGKGHNVAILKGIERNSIFHLVINPDVYFNSDVLTPMINWMKKHNDIGLMMPKILNPDGSLQYLPKLLPSPLNLILRKFSFFKFINDKYQLSNVEESIFYNAPILSGCFTLINIKLVKKIGFYDEKYFLYFEDWDFSRRVHLKYNTIYFPLVEIYHAYQSDANKSLKSFFLFLKSAVRYFNKWGWIFDNQRAKFNNRTLSQF